MFSIVAQHPKSATLVFLFALHQWAPTLALAQEPDGTAQGQPPVDAPPPPPAELPSPPEPQAIAPVDAPSATIPEGQWVYTDQYGWVFMPYSQNYTYVGSTDYPYVWSGVRMALAERTMDFRRRSPSIAVACRSQFFSSTAISIRNAASPAIAVATRCAWPAQI
jgi:hypothetical protein